jgi:hypothetical protein
MNLVNSILERTAMQEFSSFVPLVSACVWTCSIFLFVDAGLDHELVATFDKSSPNFLVDTFFGLFAGTEVALSLKIASAVRTIPLSLDRDLVITPGPFRLIVCIVFFKRYPLLMITSL